MLTTHTLAIIVGAWICSLLPGHSYRSKPAIDWGKPHAYFGLVRELASLAIVLRLLF